LLLRHPGTCFIGESELRRAAIRSQLAALLSSDGLSEDAPALAGRLLGRPEALELDPRLRGDLDYMA
jgi:hypothetical protein